MQGPLVDLVLMLLLILFFGVQQRGRPQRYYRYWLVGWLFVLTSFALFEVSDEALLRIGAWTLVLRRIVQLGTLFVGGLSFLLSFMGPEAPLQRLVRRVPWWLLGTELGVWAAVFTVPLFLPMPFWIAATLIVVGEAKASWILWRTVPEEWPRLRWIVTSLCVPGAVLGVVAAWMASLHGRAGLGPAFTGFGEVPDSFMSLDTVVLGQILLGAALLFGNASRARRLVKLFGCTGFALWAVWYVAGDLLHAWPPALKVFYEFWQLPKYCVGLAMILEIFDATESEVRRLAEGYRLLYEDFRVLYENHPHPMWIREVKSDRCVSANGAALRHYGYTEPEFLLLTPEQIEIQDGQQAERIDGLHVPATGHRVQHLNKDGRVMWMNVSESEILFQGQEARLVMARDISEQLKITRELTRRANYDGLTGLPNRTLLTDRAELCLARSRRDRTRCVVFAIDVDHFKAVNDTYGHPVGDECLKAVAARLQSRVRQADTLARTGGEEFTALIGGLSQMEDAEKIGLSLLGVMHEPLALKGIDSPLPVTISIGGAIFPDDGGDIVTLCRVADEALYAAKRSGRNCVRMYSAWAGRDAESDETAGALG